MSITLKPYHNCFAHHAKAIGAPLGYSMRVIVEHQDGYSTDSQDGRNRMTHPAVTGNDDRTTIPLARVEGRRIVLSGYRHTQTPHQRVAPTNHQRGETGSV